MYKGGLPGCSECATLLLRVAYNHALRSQPATTTLLLLLHHTSADARARVCRSVCVCVCVYVLCVYVCTARLLSSTPSSMWANAIVGNAEWNRRLILGLGGVVCDGASQLRSQSAWVGRSGLAGWQEGGTGSIFVSCLVFITRQALLASHESSSPMRFCASIGLHEAECTLDRAAA